MTSSPEFDFDAAVVGAGAVGMACGYFLALAGKSVVVLEKERLIGQGVSSRNSEVIHAGLYYPTGSLKAELCVRGRRLLYPFLQAHGVGFDKCGKIVVATDEEEAPRVEAVAEQARINGVEGLRLLTADEVKAMEPEAKAVMGLWSPETGIFDSHGYMVALEGEIEAHGGAVATATPFEGAEALPGGGFKVRTGGDDPAELTVRQLIIASGLGAQAAAARVADYPGDQIPALHYGKGVYFALNAKPPFRRLVYPPPGPSALGIHYKRDMGGRAHFGPDLQFVEVENYDVDPGRAPAFYGYVRHFWPGLPDGALSPDYAGIRPKLHGPGEHQPDFRIDGAERHGLPGLIALFGIESPGLTASMGIGEKVAALLAEP
ncbi:MAG TPA: NAD(P)/FAD-dependent oxidoreductase [Caulobacteraceae bacterium]|jgi:L-2-hydroxyglutarate oxidase LhgO